MNILLKKEWKKLKTELEKNKKIITPLHFVYIILNWSKRFENFKDKKIKNYYMIYLYDFQKLNIEEYDFEEKWYDFNGLLEFIIFHIDKDTDRLITILYEALVEILIVKINIPGEIELYYYRVYTDCNKKNIYYITDLGGFVFDIDLNKIELKEKVIPAPAYLIEQYNIQICQEFEDYKII